MNEIKKKWVMEIKYGKEDLERKKIFEEYYDVRKKHLAGKELSMDECKKNNAITIYGLTAVVEMVLKIRQDE